MDPLTLCAIVGMGAFVFTYLSVPLSFRSEWDGGE